MKMLIALAATIPLAAASQEPTEVPTGLLASRPGVFEGYTLYTPLKSKTTFLVDMKGEIAHRWEADSGPGQSVFLLESGRLLRTAREENSTFRGGGQGGRLVELDWDGNITWDYLISSDDHLSHHDVAPLPNGNVLVIAWELVESVDAVAAGRDPEQVGRDGLWPDYVFEVEPQRPDGGKVVWEWHAWDHRIQDFDSDRTGHGDVTRHPELLDVNVDHRREPPLTAQRRAELAEVERQMRALGYTGDDEDEEEHEEQPKSDERGRRRRGGDWMHSNSIDYHAQLDLVLLSSRVLSEILILDHSTTTEQARGSSGGRWGRGGDILYRWGNPKNYGFGTGKDQQLFQQHDATFLGGADDLRVLVFNNGGGRPGDPYSTVDEIVLPFDPERGFVREEGAACGPSAAAWSYAAPNKQDFYASFISGAQRLPNGNTLVSAGPTGRMFEVTRGGEVVWDFVNPFAGEPAPSTRGPRQGGGGPPADGGGPPAGRDRGGPRMAPGAVFRSRRLAPDHPGLQGRDL